MRDPVTNYVREISARLRWDDPVLNCCAGWEPDPVAPLFAGHKYLRQDIRDYDPHCIDFVCDIYCMGPVGDASCGCLLLLEALEHLRYPERAIAECQRVLRPGGLLIATTLFSYPIHRYPRDYWRYAPDIIGDLFAEFTIEDLTVEGYAQLPRGIWIAARKPRASETADRGRNETLVMRPRVVPILDNLPHSFWKRWLVKMLRSRGIELYDARPLRSYPKTPKR